MAKKEKAIQIEKLNFNFEVTSKVKKSLSKMSSENGFKNIEDMLYFWMIQAKEGNLTVNPHFTSYDLPYFLNDDDEAEEDGLNF